MRKDTLIEFIKNEIVRFTEENTIPLTQINDTTELVGTNGIFSTLDMLAFGLELEEKLVEKFNLHVELTSDTALASKRHPFINSLTLANFVMSEIQLAVEY